MKVLSGVDIPVDEKDFNLRWLFLPEISVLMSVYNSEKYVKEAINSILNQTYGNFEFIVVNDGSNDNTGQIIKDFFNKDNRIQFISRTENKGIGYSLNEAWYAAQGDFIALMDDDDISHPNRFARQISQLQTSNIDILGTYVEVFGQAVDEQKTRIQTKLNLPIDSVNAAEVFLTYWHCFAKPSVMMKRKVLEELRGFKNRTAEDYDLWMRAIRHGFKIGKLPEKLLKCRIRHNSATKVLNRDLGGIADAINIKLTYLADIIKNKIKRYLIWGTGSGGEITRKALSIDLPQAELIGYLDNYKEGFFNGNPIYKSTQISELSFDYIFIATEPGKEEAIKILRTLGLENIKDFLCTV